MSTTQQSRLYSPAVNDQIISTWSSVFIDEFSTVSHSTTFVKQLLALALSCITYLRSFFTELRELQFIVYEHDPNHPLEVYTFNFTYNENGSASMSKLKGRSKQSGVTFNIKVPTVKMIRSIILLIQSFDQLPDTVFFGFKLFYYDDVTPPDYEPLGFMPIIHHETRSPSKNSAKIKVGQVQTVFHKVKLKVDTVYCRSLGNNVRGPDTQTKLQVSLSNNHHTASDFNDDKQENPAPPSPEPAVCRSIHASGMKKMLKKQMLSVKLYGKSMSSTVKTDKHNRNRNASYSPKRISLYSRPGYNNLDSRDGSTQSLLNKTSVRQSYTHSPFITENPIRCPCGVYIEDGLMITCTICSFRQHAACFKLLEEKDLELRHVCEICANLTHSCTDSSLTNTDVIQVRETCLFRRLLLHLRNDENHHTPASLAQLLHVTTHVGKRLMVRLQSEGALASEPSNDPRGRLVDQKMLLQYVIPHMFHEEEVPDYQRYTSSLQIIRELVIEEDQNSDTLLNVTSSDIQENADLKCDRLRSVTNGTLEEDPHNYSHQNHTIHCSKQNDALHGTDKSHPMKLRRKRNCQHQIDQELEIQNFHIKKRCTSSPQVTRELGSEKDQISDMQLNSMLHDIHDNVNLKSDKIRSVANEILEEDPLNDAQQNHTIHCPKQNDTLQGDNRSYQMILRPGNLGQEEIQNILSKKIFTSSQQISRELVSEEDTQENGNFKCYNLRSVAKEKHKEGHHNNVRYSKQNDALHGVDNSVAKETHKEGHHNNVHYSKQNDALHGVDNRHPMILRQRGNCQHQLGQELEIQTIHSKKMYTSSLQIIRERVNEEYQKSELQMTVTLTDIQKNSNLNCDKQRSVANSTNKDSPHHNAHQNYTAHCSKQNDDHHAKNSYQMILRSRQNHEHHLGQALEIHNIQNKRVNQSAQKMPKRRKV